MGNPPFLGGQKITGFMGDCYRDYLVESIAQGKRGSADLVAYFFIKVNQLLAPKGFFGLIAVNTISEGSTREIGLDSVLEAGSTIFRANPNLVWPGSANVVTSSVYISKSAWLGAKCISHQAVPKISSSLTHRENWRPVKLAENSGLVFQGAIILGDGFLVKDRIYAAWQVAGDRSCNVVFDYLIGKEVNQSPTHQPGRKVINFFDWEQLEAEKFHSAYDHVNKYVKPERQRLKDGGNEYALRSPLPQRWWQYGEKRPALFHAVGRGHSFSKHPKGWDKSQKSLDQVIVFATGATKYPCFTFVPNTYIYANTLCVIASESYSLFACLSSDLHAVWAWEHGSRMKQDLRYTHGDVFETFPFPDGALNGANEALTKLGERYFHERSVYMVKNDKGMTKFYNDLHDPAVATDEIESLRKLQAELNHAVLQSYGFDDVELSHGFHDVAYLPEGKNTRFTISEEAREKLLYRLAMLNKAKHEAESKNLQSKAAPKSVRKKTAKEAVMQGGLFDEGVDQ